MDANLQVAGSKQTVTLKRGTGSRRANKIAAAETAGKGYRGDLRSVSQLSGFIHALDISTSVVPPLRITLYPSCKPLELPGPYI
jgi:hypothetical protein